MNDFLVNLMAGLADEILKMIRDHFNSTGQLPTDAEIKAKIRTHADRIIETGQAWLDAHKDD